MKTTKLLLIATLAFAGTALQAQERRVDDYKEEQAALRQNTLVFR